ncbi:MAG: putative glycine betaine/choline-binding protein of an ABC-type transport system [Frankiales bacterium]|jgi:osmoprotectant transport system substrate-binding protein|nr:putative glycine betaine/choline-binding protein of an ABC-type transport system [Frankiales bacterium]
MVATRRTASWVLLGLLLLVGCSGSAERAGPDRGIRVASFDFAESRLLAEVYATALEQGGFRVDRHLALGPREVVAPALAQDLVDLVPEYAGSALQFLSGQAGRSADLRAALDAALTRRGLTALRPAPGQDQNGVVVSRALAEREQLETVSDLVPVAGRLVLGGPPECPERPLCLRGLEQRYGLAFSGFVPFPSRAATAEALLAGQLDVGVLETVDPYLADGRLVLLVDDRGLQPPEPVVPVLRQEVLVEHGPELARLLDRVSAALTTAAMTELNRQVVLQGVSERDAAAAWLRGLD